MYVIDQLPGEIEWRVYKGDTATFSLFVLEDDDTPVDLSEWTFTGQIKFKPTDTVEEFTLVVTATEEGLVTITIPDTASIEKSMYFDVQGVKDGITKTFVRGTIIADQDVTR